MLTCPLLILRSPPPTLQPPPLTLCGCPWPGPSPCPPPPCPTHSPPWGWLERGLTLASSWFFSSSWPSSCRRCSSMLPCLSSACGQGQVSAARCLPSCPGHLFPASWCQVVSGDRGLRGQRNPALPLPPWSKTALKLPGAASPDTGNSPHTSGKTPPEGMSCLQRN